MRKMWMIAALVLLALSVSGCANADYSEGTPSSEETVITEPVQSIAPQEHTTVSVSESTEISAESTEESETAEMPSEISTPAADNAALPTESGTTEPAPPKASEPPPATPTDPPMQEAEPPAAEEPAEPEFDIQTWIDYELNGDYLDDERTNLNIQLSRPILVVGDLGLWHGRRMGYKEIPSGNIRDCLYSERDIDSATWYVDKNGDLRCDAVHHDGTNHYLYRTYKDGASDTQIDNLKEKLYCGTATRADITRITRRLGDEIARVYGFPIPRRQAPAQER